MKRLFTLFLTFSSFYFLHAQVLPNGNFENWDFKLLYQEPTGYNTTNPFTLLNEQVITATLVQGMTPQDSAIHLETKMGATGALQPGRFGNVNYFTRTGGTNFTGQPDSISYRVNYKVQPGDTAAIVIYFYAQGGTQPYAGSNLFFTGSSNGWVEVNEPLQFPANRATAAYIMEAYSSLNNDIAQEGSILEIDYIHLNSQEQIENPDMEDWDNIEYEVPDNYESLDAISAILSLPSFAVTKDTNAFEGDYAVKIQTQLVKLGPNIINQGILHTGNAPNWYLPLDKLPASMEGLYKHETPNGKTDVGVAALILVSKESPSVPRQRDTLILPYLDAADWTKFKIDLQPLNLPQTDSFSLIFFASDPSNPVSGSALYLDDLKFVPITEVNEPGVTGLTPSLKIMPNPVTEYFTISGLTDTGEGADVAIYDQSGKLLQRFEQYKSKQKISVRDYSSGYYSIRIAQPGYVKTLLFYKH